MPAEREASRSPNTPPDEAGTLVAHLNVQAKASHSPARVEVSESAAEAIQNNQTQGLTLGMREKVKPRG